VELNEVISGVRKLTDEDILGPKEQDARQKLNVKNVDPGSTDKKRDYSRYFLAVEQKLKDKRVSKLKQRALEVEREERIKKREARVQDKMKREASVLS
jgi:hypothetical protein